jgi:hypothetical protein
MPPMPVATVKNRKPISCSNLLPEKYFIMLNMIIRYAAEKMNVIKNRKTSGSSISTADAMPRAANK